MKLTPFSNASFQKLTYIFITVDIIVRQCSANVLRPSDCSSDGGDYSRLCYDSSLTPYFGTIPHPTICDCFATCIPDHAGKPYPAFQNCASNSNFDFDTCQCRFPNDAVCYKWDKCSHQRRFFHCACPLAPCKITATVKLEPSKITDKNAKEL